jgi:hypothetical protein
MKQFSPFLMMALLISACTPSETYVPVSTPVPSAETALPTVTPACIPPEPTAEDVEHTLSFAQQVLGTGEWDRTSEVSDGSVSVTWQNIPESAVIHIETLIFPCGYEEQDLDSYFNNGNWDAIFADYEGYELTAECSTNDGLRLYQFEATHLGFDYDVQYWVLNDTDTRVMTTLMIFPFGSESLLEDYSFDLFPELAICP